MQAVVVGGGCGGRQCGIPEPLCNEEGICARRCPDIECGSRSRVRRAFA